MFESVANSLSTGPFWVISGFIALSYFIYMARKSQSKEMVPVRIKKEEERRDRKG